MSQRICRVCVLVGLVVLAAPLSAQEPEPPPPVAVRPLTGSLSILLCNGQAAMVACTGADGILLVDTGYAGTAAAAEAALGELSEGPARLIVNTHGDGDHVGGNESAGDRGDRRGPPGDAPADGIVLQPAAPRPGRAAHPHGGE